MSTRDNNPNIPLNRLRMRLAIGALTTAVADRVQPIAEKGQVLEAIQRQWEIACLPAGSSPRSRQSH
jgi:hypothetical protein